MNGISHKQAVQYIHRQMDGLLDESQRSSLNEHLRSCDSCRAYATDMEGLSAHLQNEFHRRWDVQPGPSQNVSDRVTARAGKLLMKNRIAASTRVFAGAVALITLGFAINFVISRLQNTSPVTNATKPATSAPLSTDRLLAFASYQNGNSDIYTMHADGSGLTNLSNTPSYDGTPFWSPDGTQIAFVSDRDGSAQIYLMNADGSNVIQLTHDQGDSYFDGNGITPWSPDGKRLVFVNRQEDEQKVRLYTIDLAEKTTVTLTNEQAQYLHPSWSPDGRSIAFTSDPGRIPQDLFVVGNDGNGLKKLTENLPAGEFFLFGYEWSLDGSILFSTSRNQQAFQDATYIHTLYEANVDGSMTAIYKTTDSSLIDWWNGIAVRRESEQRLSWLRPDGSRSTLDLCPNSELLGIAHKRSHTGNLVIGSNCSDNGWVLYWANPNGAIIGQLLDSPITTDDSSLFNMTWSPDDQYLSFVGLDTSSTNLAATLYVFDVAKAREDPSVQPLKMTNSSSPSWQPVAGENLAKEIPTPEPTSTSSYNGLIAFTAAADNGNLDIFTMQVDGSGLTNLTNNPANHINPFWSPDGSRIAFESDSDGFMQIYSMDADGSNLLQLTNDTLNHELPANYFNGQSPWSPDGTRLMFLQKTSEDEKSMLYVMDRNGENKTPLFGEPDDYTALSWSPDGGHIAFISTDPQNEQIFRIYVVDREGKGLTDLTQLLPDTERLDSFQYNWAPGGQSVFFIAYKHISEGNDQWTAYEASLHGGQLIERARSSTPMADWWKDTSFITGFGLSTLTWLHADGTFNTFNPWDNCASVNDGPYGFLARRSSHGNQLINVDCPNDDMWFYFANPDGSAVIQLLRSPLSVREGGIGNILWSSDDRFVALTISSPEKTSLYILDMAASVQNPSIEPVQITISDGLSHYSPSWQPIH